MAKKNKISLSYFAAIAIIIGIIFLSALITKVVAVNNVPADEVDLTEYIRLSSCESREDIMDMNLLQNADFYTEQINIELDNIAAANGNAGLISNALSRIDNFMSGWEKKILADRNYKICD